MSQANSEDGIVELQCRVVDLQVIIKGPAGKATRLLRDITLRGDPESPARASGASEDSFSVVTEAAAPSNRRAETRVDIEASFPKCPDYLVREGQKLSGGPISGAARVERAWTAGQWARAFAQGRASSPNATPQLALQNRFYVVLKADGLERPTIFCSARSYWQCVGDLKTSTSISHSFPSEQEAKTYLFGAGESIFDFKP